MVVCNAWKSKWQLLYHCGLRERVHLGYMLDFLLVVCQFHGPVPFLGNAINSGPYKNEALQLQVWEFLKNGGPRGRLPN